MKKQTSEAHEKPRKETNEKKKKKKGRGKKRRGKTEEKKEQGKESKKERTKERKKERTKFPRVVFHRTEKQKAHGYHKREQRRRPLPGLSHAFRLVKRRGEKHGKKEINSRDRRQRPAEKVRLLGGAMVSFLCTVRDKDATGETQTGGERCRRKSRHTVPYRRSRSRGRAATRRRGRRSSPRRRRNGRLLRFSRQAAERVAARGYKREDKAPWKKSRMRERNRVVLESRLRLNTLAKRDRRCGHGRGAAGWGEEPMGETERRSACRQSQKASS
ncbi:hypothetical protein TGVAND_218390 [Toxoplasma gondii VAND]|uniref:Uncharacterized protein n=1 Tax=Toxoplasma gondii VAND TaxID=933077 RepID=A0A086PXW7_TOXGO|nr:hypothetical protein TGVAND_218390 [Toxoplasma gondii VAND]